MMDREDAERVRKYYDRIAKIPPTIPAKIAQAFHATCEEIETEMGWVPRDRVPWSDLPLWKRSMMTEAIQYLIDAQIILPGRVDKMEKRPAR